ncbi:MAG: sugar phosphate isomerase/epimerase [Verrucomicrobiales bacterium]|nr:sugar phosphate isomerase/epimerase [Verrucomicrobiales bacterium]
MITRRKAIPTLIGSATLAGIADVISAGAKDFQIGACDWSIGQQQNIAAFDVAKRIGLEGLQVSFSDPGKPFDLRDQKVREQYYRKIDETGIQMASLGMGILNQKPLATHPDAINWVNDAIETIAKIAKEEPDKKPSVCLLAFFGKGDINGKPELMETVIQKLKTVSEKAEDNGVVLGIESLLSVDDHLKVIDGVGSKNIQVYYDSANSNKMGYNIYEEVVKLGAERICEVHCKENKNWIGEGVVDFAKFRDSLNTAGYKGWLIIEGSTPDGADLVKSYRKNMGELDRIFRGRE